VTRFPVRLVAASVLGIALLAAQTSQAIASPATAAAKAATENQAASPHGSRQLGVTSQTGSAIVPGFNSETFGPNDDGSYPCTSQDAGVPPDCTPTQIPLPFPLDFYGTEYSSLYLNNNGNLTFGQPLGEYTPESLNQINIPMIAPFWADVDTRTGPVVTFGYGTVNGHLAFGVNWIGVGCYSENTSVADTFQVLLIDRPDLGAGHWNIEFNYGPITWDSGQASGGDGQCLGGTAARAGYTSGLGPSCELPGSGVNGGLLSSNPQTGLSSHELNSSVPGQYVFEVGSLGQPNGCGSYVALGDSYSSGQGTGDFNFAGPPCDRGSYAWPALLSDDYLAAPPLTPSSFFACSGDTTTELLNGKPGEPVSQIQQLQNWTSSNGSPGLLTVTVGGDDLGFATILEHCVIIGAPSCLSQLNTRISYLRSGAFTSVLANTYSRIKSAAGGTQVVVVGYPFLFPIPSFSNDLVGDLECIWLDGDAGQIFARFQQGQLLLDSVMAQAASQAGVLFIPLDDVFAGHELCTSDPYINHLLSLSSNAGHPNVTGQSVIANYVAAQLGYLAGSGSSSEARPAHAKKTGKTTKAGLGSGGSKAATGATRAARPQGSAPSATPAHLTGRAASSTPAISSGLTGAETSVPYTGFLWATGGTAPYTWAVTSGSPPAGLSLDTSTGIISGTPTGSGTSTFTVTVTDSSSPAQTASASESISVAAVPALAVGTTALPSPTVGQQYAATLSATGGIAPYTWSVSAGSLPAGLSLDSSTGAITGTPTSAGSVTFTVTAADSSTGGSTATGTFTINVAAASTALTTTTPQLPAGTQGTGYVGTLTSTGGTGPVSWSITSGSLPAGLSVDPDTGQITGTPTAAGTFSFGAEVTDSSSPTPQTATENLSITIAASTAPSIDSTVLPDAVQGSAYDQVISATGGVVPYTWSVTSGALPAGLSLDPQAGTITGTPTTPGTYSFTVSLADSSTPAAQNASISLAMTVDAAPPPPAMTVTDTTTSGIVGAPYNAILIPSGGTGPYSYAVTSGALPAGLSLDPQFGTITGTPTTAGTFDATIQVTDSSSPTPEVATDDVSIAIASSGTLAISTTSLPDAAVGASYAEPVVATGGTGALSFAVTSGALPAGLTLDPASGIIYGVPTASGPSSFTVTVTDSATPTPDTSSASLTLNTDAATSVSVSTTSLLDATQNQAYTQILAASGGVQPYTWSISSGNLPAGLSLNATTGVISGTPTGSGSSAFTVEATDSSSPTPETATESLTLDVNAAPPLGINTVALPEATQGTAYSAALDAGGGTSPVTWSVVSGALPAGLALDPDAGVISGTPTGTGTSYFTVQATDSSSPAQTATAALSIEVEPPQASLLTQSISFTAPAPGVVGESATLSATGGGSGNPVVFSVDASSGNGVCTISGTTVDYAGIGSCVIDANQAGNSVYSPAPEVQQTVSVGQATSSTVLSVSGAATAYGHEQTTVFSVTVHPEYTGTPTGTVTVKTGATTLCTATLSGGTATCSPNSATVLAPGSDSVTAAYSGSTDFGGSVSAASTLKIAKASTRSTLSLSTSSATYGHEKALVVTVKVSPQYAGTPGGTVTVKAGRVTICSKALSRGKASCSPRSGTALRVGKYQLVATYPGNADFSGSKSAARTLKVVKPAKKAKRASAIAGQVSAVLRIAGLIARSFEYYGSNL
jgi:hypothetical protein